MKITIAQRLKPFSHTPGMSCPIPGTWSILTAFPTRLILDDVVIKLPFTGPVTGFTVQNDLEKNCIYIFGKAVEGYFRIRVEAHSTGFHIIGEKGAFKSTSITKEIQFTKGKALERLSLGNHKAQDWDLVQRRMDLKEILPTLFYLGQKVPTVEPQKLAGTAQLLELPKERKLLEKAFTSLLLAGFSQMLVPRLFDEEFQGLSSEEPVEGNPFFLLQEGAKLIRSLFFTQNDRRLALLPNLPISFDAGRMLSIQANGVGKIDMEWSKKVLKKCILHSSFEGEVLLDLQKEIKTYRVNGKKRVKRDAPLLLDANKVYFLDRFEK